MHEGQESEIIFEATWKQREPVKVLTDTATVYDPTLHGSQDTEIISNATLKRRLNIIKVKGPSPAVHHMLNHNEIKDHNPHQPYSKSRKRKINSVDQTVVSSHAINSEESDIPARPLKRQRTEKPNRW